MRRSPIALAFAVAVGLAFAPGGGSAASAAKRKKTKSSATVKKDDAARPPAPDDKGTNESGTGRKNATEDAARAAESPINDHRP